MDKVCNVTPTATVDRAVIMGMPELTCYGCNGNWSLFHSSSTAPSSEFVDSESCNSVPHLMIKFDIVAQMSL